MVINILIPLNKSCILHNINGKHVDSVSNTFHIAILCQLFDIPLCHDKYASHLTNYCTNVDNCVDSSKDIFTHIIHRNLKQYILWS